MFVHDITPPAAMITASRDCQVSLDLDDCLLVSSSSGDHATISATKDRVLIRSMAIVSRRDYELVSKLAFPWWAFWRRGLAKRLRAP